MHRRTGASLTSWPGFPMSRLEAKLDALHAPLWLYRLPDDYDLFCQRVGFFPLRIGEDTGEGLSGFEHGHARLDWPDTCFRGR